MKTMPAIKRFLKDIALVLVLSTLLVVIFTSLRSQKNRATATPTKGFPCTLSQAGTTSNYDPVTTVGTIHVYMNCEAGMGWGCYAEQTTCIYKWVNGAWSLVYVSPITPISMDCSEQLDVKTVSVFNAWGIPGDTILMQSVIRTGVFNVVIGLGEVQGDL